MKRKIKGTFRSDNKNAKLNAVQEHDQLAEDKPSSAAMIAFKRSAYPRLSKMGEGKIGQNKK